MQGPSVYRDNPIGWAFYSSLSREVLMYPTYIQCIYSVYIYLYPGVGANYGWIKGKSVLTFVM